MSVFLMTPSGMAAQIAKRVRAKRLSQNLTQQTLSKRSGVSYGTLKKFESTGKISLLSLLKLAICLGVLEDFKDLFAETKPEEYVSLDKLLSEKKRKRGRK